MSSERILLVEDSAAERAVLVEQLERLGYRVAIAANGREGLRVLYETRPDLVLLDVVMPELDGWKTLELIRDVSEVPVIMLTARTSEIERVRGLRTGADDYVGKPFSRAELAARIEAVLRRTGKKPTVRDYFDDGTIAIDFAAHEVRVRGEPVLLTPKEFRMLVTLVEHAGHVLSREQLLEHVWGAEDAVTSDQVKLYVGYLRRKLERDPSAPELIETVRGFGYRYRKPPKPAGY